MTSHVILKLDSDRLADDIDGKPIWFVGLPSSVSNSVLTPPRPLLSHFFPIFFWETLKISGF